MHSVTYFLNTVIHPVQGSRVNQIRELLFKLLREWDALYKWKKENRGLKDQDYQEERQQLTFDLNRLRI